VLKIAKECLHPSMTITRVDVARYKVVCVDCDKRFLGRLTNWEHAKIPDA